MQPSSHPRIAVLGSLVFDLALWVHAMPATDETVLAHGSRLSCGGKGLCQAIAAARMGARVQMIGRVGNDPFGDNLMSVLGRHGIDHTHVRKDQAGTHLGVPIITPDGHNRIIGVPRASHGVDESDVLAAQDDIQRADMLIVQSELPIRAISLAIQIAGQAGKPVIWNPAPAVFSLARIAGLPHGPHVTWLTPNQPEAQLLAGMPINNMQDAEVAAGKIRRQLPGAGVVITLGEMGVVAVDRDGGSVHLPGLAVQAVDPTGAGDAFTGTFGAGIAHGWPTRIALEVANAAGASATARPGAADAIASASAVGLLLDANGYTDAFDLVRLLP